MQPTTPKYSQGRKPTFPASIWPPDTVTCLIYPVSSRHVPGSQKDPGSWIPRVQDPRSWRILDLIFSFSLGILEILDPATAALPLDPTDPESRTENIFLDPGDPRSSLGNLSWDLADLGSYTTMSLHLEDSVHPIKFCFWFHISMRSLNLTTVKIFIHILIQPSCVDLKTSSPCWFLHMFFFYRVIVNRLWQKENERTLHHFTKHDV